LNKLGRLSRSASHLTKPAGVCLAMRQQITFHVNPPPADNHLYPLTPPLTRCKLLSFRTLQEQFIKHWLSFR